MKKILLMGGNQYSLIKGLEKTYKYNEENNLIKEPVLNAIEKSFGNYKI